jgi:hypothetical protein
MMDLALYCGFALGSLWAGYDFPGFCSDEKMRDLVKHKTHANWRL